MTLKTHVILHHYGFYFSITGKTIKDTNGEALHNTLRIHEDVHKQITHILRHIQSQYPGLIAWKKEELCVYTIVKKE